MYMYVRDMALAYTGVFSFGSVQFCAEAWYTTIQMVLDLHVLETVYIQVFGDIDITPPSGTRTYPRAVLCPHDAVPLAGNHTCRFAVTWFHHLTLYLVGLSPVEGFGEEIYCGWVSRLLTAYITLTTQFYPRYCQYRPTENYKYKLSLYEAVNSHTAYNQGSRWETGNTREKWSQLL